MDGSILPEGTEVEKVLNWKLYFDTRSKLPCGRNYSVVVCAPDEELPPYVNKPMEVEERLAVMVILKKTKAGQGKRRRRAKKK